MKNIAKLLAFVGVIIGFVLILNYIQLKLTNPLESQGMEQLIEQLRDNPENHALKDQIRSLDLLVRKAYFTSLWQIRTGAYLLLFCFATSFLISFVSKNKRLDKADIIAHKKEYKKKGSNSLLFPLAFVFGISLVAVFFTNEELEVYEVLTTKVEIELNNEQGEDLAEALSPETDIEETERVEEIEVIAQASKKKVTEDPTPAKPKVKEVEKEEVSKTEEEKENATSLEGNETEMKGEEQETTILLEKPVSKSNITISSKFFRGDDTSNCFERNISTNWSSDIEEDIRWQATPPKAGFNSPVFYGNMLFISGADESTREVYCYDRGSGELRWTYVVNDIEGSPDLAPETTEDTGLAASTLATNGSSVYAIFGTGDLVALTMDGKKMWGMNLGVPDNHYGHSSSLLVHNDKLLVQYDTNRSSKLMAFATNDGKLLWETVRSNVKISWASPCLITGEKPLVVLTAEPFVIAYNPDTGKEIWKVECMSGEVGPSVTYADGVIFAANEYAKLVAIDPQTAKISWEYDEYLPEVASPVASNGMVVIATSYGVLVACDSKTGEKLWEKECDNGFYSSPAVVDDCLYAIDLGGEVHIIKMDATGEEIATVTLPEDVMTTPVFGEDCIYIRGVETLYCIAPKQ